MKLKLLPSDLEPFVTAATALAQATVKRDELFIEAKKADFLALRTPSDLSLELDFIVKGKTYIKQCTIVRDCYKTFISFYTNEQT